MFISPCYKTQKDSFGCENKLHIFVSFNSTETKHRLNFDIDIYCKIKTEVGPLLTTRNLYSHVNVSLGN